MYTVHPCPFTGSAPGVLYSDMLVFLMLGFLSYSTLPVGVFVVWARLRPYTLALECDDHLSLGDIAHPCLNHTETKTKVISNFSISLGFIPSLFNFTFGFVLTF